MSPGRRCALAMSLVMAACPSLVRAECAVYTPMYHLFDSFFACDDRSPIPAFAYQQSDPAGTNTDGRKITCEAVDGVACNGMSGSVGDGRMTIETDWSLPGIVGCPVSPAGPRRVNIVLA